MATQQVTPMAAKEDETTKPEKTTHDVSLVAKLASKEETFPRVSSESTSTDSTIKRYNLALPSDLYAQPQRLAAKNHTTVLELLKKLIRIGLFVLYATERPDTTFVIREGNQEREIHVF